MREQTLYVRIVCDATKDVFAKDWQDILPKNRSIIVENNGIGCEGTGNVGLYCNGCPFTDWDGEWEED